MTSSPHSGRYRTIVADPPWQQRYAPTTIGSQKERLANITATVTGREFPPYPTMSLDEVKSISVRDLAHNDGCNLFLWVTNSMLRHAWSVLDSWGFRYAQTVVWQKTNPSQLSGTGSFAVMDVEFLLVGRSGRAPFEERQPSSVFLSAGGSRRGADGSTKSDAVVDAIETASPGPYLELFARRQRLGWDTWGNEALEHVELTA